MVRLSDFVRSLDAHFSAGIACFFSLLAFHFFCCMVSIHFSFTNRGLVFFDFKLLLHCLLQTDFLFWCFGYIIFGHRKFLLFEYDS